MGGIGLTDNPILAHAALEMACSALLGLAGFVHVVRDARAPGRQYSSGMGLLWWAGATATGLHALQPAGIHYFGHLAPLEDLIPWTGAAAASLVAAGIVLRPYDAGPWSTSLFAQVAVGVLALVTLFVATVGYGLLPPAHLSYPIPRPLDLILSGVFAVCARRTPGMLGVGAGLFAGAQFMIAFSAMPFDAAFWWSHFVKLGACWAVLMSVEVDG